MVLLGLWVGAMATFAFLFAPIAFAHIGATPEFAATIAACVRTIGTMSVWIGIAVVAITLLVRTDSPRIAPAIVACVAVALAASFVETSLIVPQMEHTPLLTPAYEALHRASSGVYSVTFLAAFAALIMSGLPYRSR